MLVAKPFYASQVPATATDPVDTPTPDSESFGEATSGRLTQISQRIPLVRGLADAERVYALTTLIFELKGKGWASEVNGIIYLAGYLVETNEAMGTWLGMHAEHGVFGHAVLVEPGLLLLEYEDEGDGGTGDGGAGNGGEGSAEAGDGGDRASQEAQIVGGVDALVELLRSKRGRTTPYTLFDESGIQPAGAERAWRTSKLGFDLALNLPVGCPLQKLCPPSGRTWDELRSSLRAQVQQLNERGGADEGAVKVGDGQVYEVRRKRDRSAEKSPSPCGYPSPSSTPTQQPSVQPRHSPKSSSANLTSINLFAHNKEMPSADAVHEWTLRGSDTGGSVREVGADADAEDLDAFFDQWDAGSVTSADEAERVYVEVVTEVLRELDIKFAIGSSALFTRLLDEASSSGGGG
ncbi:hypothetical protein IAT38_001236 [Cryptococcus sp. DSM 104549]